MPESGSVKLRFADLEDARAIADFQVRVWSDYYSDITPGGSFDGSAVECRREAWRMILRCPDHYGDTRVLLACHGHRIVGMIAFGAQRDPALAERGFDADVSALYVDRRDQCRGIGRRLLRGAFRALAEAGFTRPSIWVLARNPLSREFVESSGAEPLGLTGRSHTVHTLDDAAYGWPELSVAPRAVQASELAGPLALAGARRIEKRAGQDLAARRMRSEPARHSGKAPA